MIIIISFPFFQFSSGFIGIEEPELFIHPGLQKKLINFLVSHEVTRKFQIFIATHSNHIVDSINFSDHVSIFTLNKKFKPDDDSLERLPDFNISNVAYGERNLLNLLGITNTSVYLTNCTIWVEGITDKLYISKFMSEYLLHPHLDSKYHLAKKFQEGINFSFVYSGGDSIVHWDFDENSNYSKEINKSIIAKNFCGKAIVVIDNDHNKNERRKEELRKILGDRLVELEVPEIENLLSSKVLKETLKTYSSVKKQLAKDFPEIKQELIAKTKIGKVIDNHLLKGIENVKKFSNTKSGSIKSTDKLDFCKRSLEFINYNTMIEPAKELTKKILDFIITENG